MCKSNPIRSDFGTKIFISDWIGLIKLFGIGLDFDIRNKINIVTYNLSFDIELIIHALSQEMPRINYPCIYQSIIAVVAALFV